MRGATLPELMLVLILMGVSAGIALPPVGRLVDRALVRGSVKRYAAVHETARQLAIARGGQARIVLDSLLGEAALEARTENGWETAARFSLGGSRLSASQATVTFNHWGLGTGLSNATLVFSRGTAAETLTVSRTGRVRLR